MSSALEIGKTFGGGRYVVERIIGTGGFGITYYVRHVELNVHYAVKEFFISGKCVREADRSTVFLQDIDPDRYAKLKRRFADEARTLAVLNNPHVVRVVDIFEENNTSYIVMEYVPGVTLQQIIERQGRMSFQDAVNCMGQLAEAVSYIHGKHVLHRDIKPENVIVTPENNVVLIDFGSAREFVHDEVQNQTAIITHGYAPIEQYNTVSKKGNYTDIYALGGVFYYLLTGVKPIDATTRVTEHMKTPRELCPEIDESVSNTIMKAMEMRPEDRYQSVREFMVDLLGERALNPIENPTQILNSTQIESQTQIQNPIQMEHPTQMVNPSQPIVEAPRKSHVWIWILLAAVIVLGAVVVYGVMRHQKEVERLAREHKAEVSRLASDYLDKEDLCERFIGKVVLDDDGYNGNKHIVIQALVALQELEDMERNPNFQETGIRPVFRQQFDNYVDNLETARDLVHESYEVQREFGMENSAYGQGLRERLDILNTILDQSVRGSARAIDLRTREND